MEQRAVTQRGLATRRRIGDAALHVLGAEGVRALTHARVDAVAGLPRGSTSNHHRSRAALVEAAVLRLVEHERQAWEAVGGAGLLEPPDRRPTDLPALVAAWLERTVTGERGLHLARYALSVEARTDPEVLALLRSGRARTEEWVRAVLSAAGALDPVTASRLLLTHLDGTLLPLVTGLRPVGPGTWQEVRDDLAVVLCGVLAPASHPPDELPSLPG